MSPSSPVPPVPPRPLTLGLPPLPVPARGDPVPLPTLQEPGALRAGGGAAEGPGGRGGRRVPGKDEGAGSRERAGAGEGGKGGKMSSAASFQEGVPE